MRNPIVLARKALQIPRQAVVYADWVIVPSVKAPFADLGILQRVRVRFNSRRDLFSRAYRNASWGSQESGSGTGSELRATEVVRANLPVLLARYNIGVLLDAPCGDWNWMQHVDLSDVKYIGADVVPEVVKLNQQKHEDSNTSFFVADLTSDPLPHADAILCRDCFIHMSYQDISAMLSNFRRSGATWLLASTYPDAKKNRNQFTGRKWRPLNMQLPPFNFPLPVEMLSDNDDINPTQLAVWRLEDLPEFKSRL
ncbi:MAG: hypothetical protein JWR34_1345 [Mycobacterium sp.]|jgi:hypothetical protein|nr:hypothetical protein [Mycobacterium sp.]